MVEGVEREGQREVLVELGARTAQGYLFSPAVPAPAFPGLLPGARVVAGLGQS